ncbi:MAG: hypothetical protein EOO84_00470 [Pantoea sp.]|uniref:hypothetical protein n=1 Tax=Pantoea TaxID=53335 RepID=UPI0007E554DC|nr:MULTISPECIES: hypothetical protein [Pantoea]RZK09307.1 MAG: hypothetical protein EOO84_00470 [Pantoea sp.]WHU87799.1 hypothetical protein A7P62_18340 [Pantoea agglomerans pv. gypsophilae]
MRRKPIKYFSILLIPIIISTCAFFYFIKRNAGYENKAISITSHLQKKNNHLNYDNVESLTGRLLKMDLDYGLITPEQYNLAKTNTIFYFNSVNSTCSKFKKNKPDFLSCANKLLGDLFSYKDSVDIGSDLSSNQSDCDSNVYLLYDIAKQNKIETRIRYLPGHAVLWFERKVNGENLFWESTYNDNHGAIADFKNKKYSFSSDIFYNNLYDEGEASNIYPILILSRLSNKQADVILADKNPLVRDNPIRKEFYYWKLNKLSSEDIASLIELLEKTPSSTNVPLILSIHYLKQNDLSVAKNYLKRIAPSHCKKLCLDTDAEINNTTTSRFIVQHIISFLKIEDNANNQNFIVKYTFIPVLATIFQWILLLLVYLLRKKWQCPSTSETNEYRNRS